MNESKYQVSNPRPEWWDDASGRNQRAKDYNARAMEALLFCARVAEIIPTPSKWCMDFLVEGPCNCIGSTPKVVLSSRDKDGGEIMVQVRTETSGLVMMRMNTNNISEPLRLTILAMWWGRFNEDRREQPPVPDLVEAVL